MYTVIRKRPVHRKNLEIYKATSKAIDVQEDTGIISQNDRATDSASVSTNVSVLNDSKDVFVIMGDCR